MTGKAWIGLLIISNFLFIGCTNGFVDPDPRDAFYIELQPNHPLEFIYPTGNRTLELFALRNDTPATAFIVREGDIVWINASNALLRFYRNGTLVKDMAGDFDGDIEILWKK